MKLSPKEKATTKIEKVWTYSTKTTSDILCKNKCFKTLKCDEIENHSAFDLT